MLPDRVSNPGPLTYESGALPIALRGPAMICDRRLLSISYKNHITSEEVRKKIQAAITEYGPETETQMVKPFLAYRIRISACFTWTDNSYLTHVISPRAG